MNDFAAKIVTTQDLYWLERAKFVATQSMDPSTKCGAVVVRMNVWIDEAYNNFPVGTPSTDELWNNREEKYARVVHAETAAVLNRDCNGATLYCTHLPCHRCAGCLINAGINRVVTFEPGPEIMSRPATYDFYGPKSIGLARELFDAAGVVIAFAPVLM